MEVKLLGYQNPTQTSFSDSGQRRCCDIHSNSGCAEGQCDSFFTYCLRAFGDDDSQEGGCSNRERMTSDINGDDESIDFSRNRVLGLDNPFHLQGFSNDYTVSCLVLLVFSGLSFNMFVFVVSYTMY